MTDSLIQPFRRNLDFHPVIIPVGLEAVAVAVPPMIGGGVTSFKMANPNPFWVHYRGWKGRKADMPGILDHGHVIAPGAVDICRTQMPDWIAAVASDEPGYPVKGADGQFLYVGQPCRLIMIYGSGT